MGQKSVVVAWAFAAALVSGTPAQADFAAGMAAARQGDFDTALVEWEPLAAAGHADAQINLGIMYERGAGVDADLVRALALFTDAAAQGHSLAAYKVGLAHQMGHGVGVDYEVAVRWFRASAEAGYPGGAYELGYSYHQGEGVSLDPQEALKWFVVADEIGWGNARPARNFTARELTPEAVEAAVRDGVAWLEAHRDVIPPGTLDPPPAR